MAADLPSLSVITAILDQLEAAVTVFADYQIRNEGSLMEVLGKLERVPISKQQLEESRLGKIINDLRKANSTSHPDIAKRCRQLIKKWQAEALGAANAASALRNGTRLTPNTPGRQSTSSNSRQTTPRSVSGRSASTTPAAGLTKPVTPANGRGAGNGGLDTSSYAPSVSPAIPKVKIKLGGGPSHASPSSTLVTAASEPAALPAAAQSTSAQVKDSGQRRKRKAEEEREREAKKARRRSEQMGRAKTANLPLVAPSASGPKLKSTAELLADMNRQLPEAMRMSIDDAKPERDDSPRRPSYAEMLDGSAESPVSNSSSRPTFSIDEPEEAAEAPRKRRGRPPGSKNKLPSAVASLASVFVSRDPAKASATSQPPPSPKEATSSQAQDDAGPGEGGGRSSPVDWYKGLPPLDPSLASEESAPKSPPPQRPDLFHHRAGGRDILFLPFTDLGLPDFVQYPALPDRPAFLSELNWAFGRKPPGEGEPVEPQPLALPSLPEDSEPL